MNSTPKFAVIFGIAFLILGCGLHDIPLICAAALLTGFGAEGVIKMEGKVNGG